MCDSDKPIAYIINEGVSDCVEFDLVGKTNNNRVIAEGKLQEAEITNRNRRYYTTTDLHNEIYSDRFKELISTGNCKGEAGHPLEMNLIRQQKVDPTLEQVWYTKIWMEGPIVKAQFCGTNNELGKSFDEDLRCGQRPSFSLRSLGSIKVINNRTNVTNLKIITYDRVYYPSYKTAYTEKIVTESANYAGNTIDEMVTEKGNRQIEQEGFDYISPIMNKDVADLILKESYNFYQVCDEFQPLYKSIKLSNDMSSVTLVDESYNTFIVPLDKYVRKSINDFCRKY